MKDFKPEIEMRDPNLITPYANNAKIHTTDQIDKIAGQIAKFGFDQPIVIDSDGVIIKGHGRREAALRLNLKKVPVIVQSLSEYEAMAARLADNEVAKGELDREILKFELGTLQRNDFELKSTGFELKTIEELLDEPVKRDRENGESQSKEETVSEDKTQFIIAVTCADEESMKQLYEELVSRELDCKLIT